MHVVCSIYEEDSEEVGIAGGDKPLPDGVTVQLLSLGVEELLLGALFDDDSELEGAELDDALPLEDGWLLDDELLERSDEELLLGRLDDGSLLLDDGSLPEDELDDELLDELDDELEELLLDELLSLDEGGVSLLDGNSELDDALPLEDGWLLDDELLERSDEELLLELLDEGTLDDGSLLLLDDGSLLLDDGSLLLLDDGSLLLDDGSLPEDELDDELEELLLDELELLLDEEWQ